MPQSDTQRLTTSLYISDLHLGHISITAIEMTKRYRELIFPILPKVDILLINGDLFDASISLADGGADDIVVFLCDLIDECKTHDVKIISVRGTFSHDRDQVKVFQSLTQNKKMGRNARYYDVISLDEIDNRRYLFLPDDLPYKNSDEILDVVQTLMSERGWDNVDYALAHGYFDFMVPGGAHQPKICYRPDQFTFVKRLVNVGHVHTTRVFETEDGRIILYNGSPERLRHNEEEDKGCYLITETSDTTLKIEFIRNENTTLFKEIENTELTSDDALEYWRAIFDKTDPNKLSYYKFTHPDVGVRLAVDKLSKEYPSIIFTHRSPKDTEKPIVSRESLIGETVKTYVPTEETFPQDVVNFLKDSNRGETLTPELVTDYLKDL